MIRLWVAVIVGVLIAGANAWADDLKVVRVTSKTLTLYTDAQASGVVQKLAGSEVVVPAGGIAVAAYDEPHMMLKITVNGQTGWVEAHRVETNQPPSVTVVCDKRAMPQATASARNAGEHGTCARKR